MNYKDSGENVDGMKRVIVSYSIQYSQTCSPRCAEDLFKIRLPEERYMQACINTLS
jgi:hypothetical protein